MPSQVVSYKFDPVNFNSFNKAFPGLIASVILVQLYIICLFVRGLYFLNAQFWRALLTMLLQNIFQNLHPYNITLYGKVTSYLTVM